MKEIKCEASNGTAYGHVPGHQYHDVDVTVTRSRKGVWTISVLETWGSAQGYDEEHGRRKVVIKDNDLHEACVRARTSAEEAGIETEYLEQSLTQASAESAEEAESAEDRSPLADVSTEALRAELAKRE